MKRKITGWELISLLSLSLILMLYYGKSRLPMRGTYESEQRADRRNSLFQLISNYKGEIDLVDLNRSAGRLYTVPDAAGNKRTHCVFPISERIGGSLTAGVNGNYSFSK